MKLTAARLNYQLKENSIMSKFDTNDKNRVWIIQCAPNYKDCMGLHLEQADGIAV